MTQDLYGYEGCGKVHGHAFVEGGKTNLDILDFDKNTIEPFLELVACVLHIKIHE